MACAGTTKQNRSLALFVRAKTLRAQKFSIGPDPIIVSISKDPTPFATRSILCACLSSSSSSTASNFNVARGSWSRRTHSGGQRRKDSTSAQLRFW
jgi:hypothetical protein